jgi:hypothetical protein
VKFFSAGFLLFKPQLLFIPEILAGQELSGKKIEKGDN